MRATVLGTYLTLIVYLLTMSNLLVLGNEIHLSFFVNPIYLQEFNSVYVCLNHITETLVQIICITTNPYVTIYLQVFLTVRGSVHIENRWFQCSRTYWSNEIIFKYIRVVPTISPKMLFSLANDNLTRLHNTHKIPMQLECFTNIITHSHFPIKWKRLCYFLLRIRRNDCEYNSQFKNNKYLKRNLLCHKCELQVSKCTRIYG